MRMSLLLAIGATLTGLAAIPAPAKAETLVVNCSSSRMVGGHQICREEARYRFQSYGTHQRFALELRAPDTHCSEVRYDILDSSRNFIGSTRFLNAGEVAVTNLDASFPEGIARVIIRGWGRTGGCNVGQMHSWGVEVKPILLD